MVDYHETHAPNIVHFYQHYITLLIQEWLFYSDLSFPPKPCIEAYP